MIKLTKSLIRLFEKEKIMLVEFKYLTNEIKYSNYAIDNIKKKLQMLDRAEILKFSRLDIGFIIEVLNMEELQDIHKVLLAIESTDDDTRKLLNQIAIEIKGRTKTEAIAIINNYSDKITD